MLHHYVIFVSIQHSVGPNCRLAARLVEVFNVDGLMAVQCQSHVEDPGNLTPGQMCSASCSTEQLCKNEQRSATDGVPRVSLMDPCYYRAF